ncbi:MAG TPA: serine/threonine-protein kinase, partial [Gemmata sp.]|nr:serine/threonine-protein kinase [Gemmata sp.]
HRDLKPANILIDRRGAVKILDLGIARLPGDDGQNQGDGSEVILGTIDYLAPEQAVDSVGVDARADLYALGATLYFLIAGHPPFPSPNLRHKLAAKQYCDPPPVHRLRPDVDAGVSAVIQKLLHREPADRFQSASDAAAALTPFAGLPSNFPARLFQLKKPSTVHDAMAAPEPEFPLPATQRIIRPDTLPTPTDLPLPQYDTSAEGHPTDEVRKSPTDLSLAALPDSAKPKSPLRSDVAPPAMALRAGSIWLWLAGLVGLVALGIAVLIAWG